MGVSERVKLVEGRGDPSPQLNMGVKEKKLVIEGRGDPSPQPIEV